MFVRLKSQIAESFNKLLEGVAVTLADGTHTTVRCMLTQFRGDWKFHRDPWLGGFASLFHAQEWFNLRTWWNSRECCHACLTTKNDYLQVPNPLRERPRRDLDNFLREAVKPGPLSALDD